MTIGDWQQASEGTADNPTVISNDVGNSIEMDTEDGLLYTAQEVAEGITIRDEDEEDVTTNSGVESDDRFDIDSQSDFDDSVDGDEDEGDENM